MWGRLLDFLWVVQSIHGYIVFCETPQILLGFLWLFLIWSDIRWCLWFIVCGLVCMHDSSHYDPILSLLHFVVMMKCWMIEWIYKYRCLTRYGCLDCKKALCTTYSGLSIVRKSATPHIGCVSTQSVSPYENTLTLYNQRVVFFLHNLRWVRLCVLRNRLINWNPVHNM
jgi:hypothetical protein